MSSKKNFSFIKNIFLYLFNALMTAILGATINKIFALYVNPTEYGIYSIVFNIFTLIVAIVFMIFTNSILRYYFDYKNNDRLDILFASIVKMFCYTSILFVILCVFILPRLETFFNNELYSSLILLFAIMFLPQGLKEISISLARCQGKAKRETVANIVAHLVKLVAFIVMFFCFIPSVESIVYGSIIGVIVSILFFVDCWNIPKDFFKIKTDDTIKKLLSFGIPLIGVPIVNYLLSSSDQLILKIFRGEYETGLYSMGYRIASNVFSLVTNFLIMASHHKIMEKYDQGNREETEKFVRNLSLLYWMIAIPVLFEVSAFSKYIILLLASEQYMSSTFVLSVCSMGIIFAGYISYTNKAWEVSKKSWMIAFFSGIGAILNIILNLIFVPKYGYNAAAVTTVISYVIVIVLSGFSGRKHLKVGVSPFDMLKLISIGVICYIIAEYLDRVFVYNFLSFFMFATLTLMVYVFFIIIFFGNKLIMIFKTFKGIDD